MVDNILDGIIDRCYDIQANIRLDNNGLIPNVLVITSTLDGEGKTTIAAAFSIALSRKGHSTVLVDTNIRKPAMYSIFNVAPSPGLAEFLQNKADVENIKQRINDKLTLITAGSSQVNPVSLIDTSEMSNFIKMLKEQGNIVVIDSPSVTTGIESLVVSKMSEGVILVVNSRKTPCSKIRFAIKDLDNNEINLLGVVLNNTI
ncbi:MAG: CpsD/CapB family tyrosine-protein kinase [Nitrospirota bacterium]